MSSTSSTSTSRYRRRKPSCLPSLIMLMKSLVNSSELMHSAAAPPAHSRPARLRIAGGARRAGHPGSARPATRATRLTASASTAVGSSAVEVSSTP